MPVTSGKRQQLPSAHGIEILCFVGGEWLKLGNWKLCLCPGSGGWGKPGDADASAQGLPAVQLYDLSSDIGETKNLQSAHPEIVAKLTRLLESQVANGRSTPGAKQPNDVKVTFMNKDHTKPKNDTQPVAKEPGN